MLQQNSNDAELTTFLFTYIVTTLLPAVHGIYKRDRPCISISLFSTSIRRYFKLRPRRNDFGNYIIGRRHKSHELFSIRSSMIPGAYGALRSTAILAFIFHPSRLPSSMVSSVDRREGQTRFFTCILVGRCTCTYPDPAVIAMGSDSRVSATFSLDLGASAIESLLVFDSRQIV